MLMDIIWSFSTMNLKLCAIAATVCGLRSIHPRSKRHHQVMTMVNPGQSVTKQASMDSQSILANYNKALVVESNLKQSSFFLCLFQGRGLTRRVYYTIGISINRGRILRRGSFALRQTKVRDVHVRSHLHRRSQVVFSLTHLFYFP